MLAFTRDTAIVMSSSDDAGRTWSTPKAVSPPGARPRSGPRRTGNNRQHTTDRSSSYGTFFYQSRSVIIPGFEPPQGQPGRDIDFTRVDEGFFDAAGIRLLRGGGLAPPTMPVHRR